MEEQNENYKWINNNKIKLLIISALVLYVLSYFVLSRTGEKECAKLGLPGCFVYVPGDVDNVIMNPALQKANYVLIVFYFPVWFIDNKVLGGPHWITPHESKIQNARPGG